MGSELSWSFLNAHYLSLNALTVVWDDLVGTCY